MQPAAIRPAQVGNAAPAMQSIQGSNAYVQGSSPNLQGGTPAPAAAPTQAPEVNTAALRNAIANAFAAPTANYNALIGDLDRSRSQNEANVYGEYNEGRSGLDLNRRQGSETLDMSKRSLDNSRASSLGKLGENIRAAYDSRLRAIGNAGGGSSGANQQLAIALHGIAEDSRGDILDQSAEQSGEITLNRKHLEESFQQAVNQLEGWKNRQISSIVSNYQTQRSQLDREMAGADAARQQALANLSVEAAQQAAAQLAQVQNAYKGVLGNFGVQGGGGQQVADQGKSAMSRYSNYDIRPFEGYDPSVTYGTGQGGSAYQAPLALARRAGDEEQTY